MPDGTVFTSFVSFFDKPVVINDAGQTAFRATTSDSNLGSIWSEGGGSLNLVTAAGQQAPGLPDGVTYRGFDGPQRILINGAGATAFNASFAPDDFQDWGFWSSESGTSTLIARTGQQAAGTPPGLVYSLNGSYYSLAFNDAGQSAFGGLLTGIGGDGSYLAGIWAHRHGNLELVARTGSHAPGTPDGVNFSDVPYQWAPALNKNGQVAFYGQLTGGGVNTTNDDGVWSEGSAGLALVARSGVQAPGMPDGTVFRDFGGQPFNRPALNGAGQVAFAAVTRSGVDATLNSGIWLGTAGNLSLAVRSGDQAPGVPNGVNFTISTLNSLALNDAGQVAFFAGLNGTGVTPNVNNVGLLSGAPGSLALVARTGDHAPGAEDGVVFWSFNRPSSGFAARTLMLNAAGQTAIYGQLTGSGIGASNDLGIWATDRSGALQLIAREGDSLEVAEGEFRTISGLTLLGDFYNFSTGNADGRPSAFNNRGQLAFSATFTDGTSGIFVSNRVAVPEPGTLLLLCVESLALFWRSHAPGSRLAQQRLKVRLLEVMVSAQRFGSTSGCNTANPSVFAT